MTSVLILSDTNLGPVLAEYLRLRGFEVTSAQSHSEAFDLAARCKYDIAILDLADRDALLKLTSDIRICCDTTIFVLQPLFDKEEQIALFEAGADDCIAQSIVPELLVAKMNAVIRRRSDYFDRLPQVFDFSGIHFDSITHTLRVVGGEVHLTPKESAVLLLLCQNANQTLDRSRILKEAWRSDSYFNARSLSVYINRLRHILEPNSPLRIISIRTRGYKLLVP